MCCISLAAVGQEREVVLDRDETATPYSPALEASGFRLTGFFVGSANYNSRIQLVPEFAGSAPVSSEPTRIDFRFDQFALGVFKTFSPWLFAGASIEIERHGHRHSHGFDPAFGCPGPLEGGPAGICTERFGTEELATEVSLHRFNITAGAPVPDLRPRGVTYARTRQPIDWVDLRLEYRFNHSNQPVFSDVAPGIPITTAGKDAHTLTAQFVVNY
jgi:hypothetical protein